MLSARAWLGLAAVIGLTGACAAGDDGAAAPDPAAAADDGADLRASRAPALRAYHVDLAETSVSGLSSGAYFAGQMAVAYSSIIRGAGLVAGGPYDCAGETVFSLCMYGSRPAVAPAIARARAWSGDTIDDVANLARQRIYLVSGAWDTTVATSVVDQVYRFYVTEGGFVPAASVRYDRAVAASHTFPTDRPGAGDNPCAISTSPYISDCGLDTAGAILAHIYGPLAPRAAGPLGGALVRFDQSEMLADPTRYGLDRTGYLYVPASCAAGARCRLHVAFHGCLQSHSVVGDRFLTNTGYNEWADTNGILVLYPQTVADLRNHAPWPSLAGANVDGCWDWVGYYGPDFDRRTGTQMAAIRRMIDRIAGAD